jgi:hypothetical protein
MPIDPKIEQPTRVMLGHAIRHQLGDLASVIQAAGNDTLLASIPLCLFASAYIAIDVCKRWPTNADIRQIGKSAAESETGRDITEQEIYEYLSLVALGTYPTPRRCLLRRGCHADPALCDRQPAADLLPEREALVGVPGPDVGRH